tara:strand:+ start:353 stop:550 length:198 start_codon:yes stop_codon:yes gene_type:complete
MADLTGLQPLECLRLRLAAHFAWIIFSEAPMLWTWISGRIIFAAMVYVLRLEVWASSMASGKLLI